MKLFVIAGEASGDALGGAVMDGLRRLAPDTAFAGIGGARMQAHGLQSLFAMEELSLMGLAEVLPRLRHLFALRDRAAAAVLDSGADALITIDSPDFCLRVARAVKARRPDLPVIHYVAPSVWAWRPGRATRMARHVDHVLALLPFEPPYMHDAGMSCDFVGHPVAAEPVATHAQAAAFRAAHGIGAAPLLMVLPGSRRSEIGRLGPELWRSVRAVSATVPGLRVVVPAGPGLAAMIRPALADLPGQPVLIDPDTPGGGAAAAKRAAFVAADAALAVSGTVSLELAAARTPMVIGFDMHPLSRAVILRLLRTDTVTLVNLVAGARVVPEFLGRAFRAEAMADAVAPLLTDPAARAPQLAAADRVMGVLGRDGPAPGLRAARSIMTTLGR